MPAQAGCRFVDVGKSVSQRPCVLSYLPYRAKLGIEPPSSFGEQIIERLRVSLAFGKSRDTRQSTQDIGFAHQSVAEYDDRPQVAGGFQGVRHGLDINQLCATFCKKRKKSPRGRARGGWHPMRIGPRTPEIRGTSTNPFRSSAAFRQLLEVTGP